MTVTESLDTAKEETRKSAKRLVGLLHDHDFRLLWFGESTSNLGSAVTGIAVPLVAVVTLKATTFSMGLLNAAAWLPWLLIGLPAGAWIDRLARRKTMLVCDLALMVLMLSVPVAWWLGVLTMTQLLLVALLSGTASMFFGTAYQAYLPALVAKHDLAEANVKLQTSSQVANLAGPGAGGLLAQTVGAVSGTLVDAVSFVVSAVCLLRIRTREPAMQAKQRETTLGQEIGEGLRLLKGDPYLRVLAVSASVDNLFLNGVYALTIVFLVRTVGTAPGVVGFLMAGDFAGGLLGAVIAARVAKRLGTGRGLLVATIGLTPFGLLIPLTTKGAGLGFFFAGLMIPSIGMVIGNVIGTSFRQSYVPARLLGRMYTSSRSIQFGVIPLGAVLGGALGTAIGVRPALWALLSALTLGKTVRLIGPIRKSRNLPTTLSPALAVQETPTEEGEIS